MHFGIFSWLQNQTHDLRHQNLFIFVLIFFSGNWLFIAAHSASSCNVSQNCFDPVKQNFIAVLVSNLKGFQQAFDHGYRIKFSLSLWRAFFHFLNIDRYKI